MTMPDPLRPARIVAPAQPLAQPLEQVAADEPAEPAADHAVDQALPRAVGEPLADADAQPEHGPGTGAADQSSLEPAEDELAERPGRSLPPPPRPACPRSPPGRA